MNIIEGITYVCEEIRSLFYLLNIVKPIYFYNFHILTFFYSSFLILRIFEYYIYVL